MGGGKPRTPASAESGQGIEPRRFRVLAHLHVVDFGGGGFFFLPAEQPAKQRTASGDKFTDELVTLPTTEETSFAAFLIEARDIVLAVETRENEVNADEDQGHRRIDELRDQITIDPARNEVSREHRAEPLQKRSGEVADDHAFHVRFLSLTKAKRTKAKISLE
uniref:hypothetical protein n=1 Tax=Aminobacter niigataensis TaxID=83265 RepID=UPI002852AE19|nr:hypothetical protein [Aminobacter niigataensis]